MHPNFVAGPDGDPVSDAFYFVHQPVTGDTTLTVRVASLAPRRRTGGQGRGTGRPWHARSRDPFAGAPPAS